MKKEHYWGWPVAGYLFLGGLGGGMMVVSSIADLFFDVGDAFVTGNILAALALAIGSGLLIFELGRPLHFWRVFSAQRSVMTVGAWMLGLLIIISILYDSFWLVWFPWASVIWLRKILAWISLLLGIGVMIYTGILLGSLRARQFWNSPVLPVLFLISGLSTGIAAQSLSVGLFFWGGTQTQLESVQQILHLTDRVILVIEGIVIFLYLLMMIGVGAAAAKTAAQSWLSGEKRVYFWFGLIGLGLVLPFILYIFAGLASVIAAICVLLGGVILRFLVVFSDDRQSLPGEERYRSLLPQGDEPFLKVWDY